MTGARLVVAAVASTLTLGLGASASATRYLFATFKVLAATSPAAGAFR
jgi:hypothetical protein